MVRINWTEQSVMDLKNIYEYISNDSVKFAKIQIIKVKMRTKILKQNPQAGKMVIELDKANIRELVEGNYRIVYKILDEHSIDILTIHHGARDISGRGIVF